MASALGLPGTRSGNSPVRLFEETSRSSSTGSRDHSDSGSLLERLLRLSATDRRREAPEKRFSGKEPSRELKLRLRETRRER